MIWENTKRVYVPAKNRHKSRILKFTYWKADGVTVRFVYPESKRVYPYPGIIKVWHKRSGKDREQPISISSHSIVFAKPPQKGAVITVLYEVML